MAATRTFVDDYPEPIGVGGFEQILVSVVLETDSVKYCAAFDGFHGRDGSDGKRFLSKRSPRATACP
ncbi:MAG: hypothetical protein FJ144_14815 [Deltaproteobacteria bacterium]|nr:hypothetical protein [Deltaproteobacteria bacterium]